MKSQVSVVTAVSEPGQRLTTENDVENLGNFIVSCLDSFQLPRWFLCGVFTDCENYDLCQR